MSGMRKKVRKKNNTESSHFLSNFHRTWNKKYITNIFPEIKNTLLKVFYFIILFWFQLSKNAPLPWIVIFAQDYNSHIGNSESLFDGPSARLWS